MFNYKNYNCCSNYSKDTAENQSISMRKENFQLLPAKKRHDSNDKVTKLFFAPADEEVISGKMLILEPTRRGSKKVITKITFDVGTRFNSFDKEVLNACTSQFVEGFNAISLGIIYRLMTGKKSTHLADSMRIAILDSLNKLISTNVTIDASQVCTALKYNGGNPFTYTGAILPAQIIDGKIRGKESTIVKFEKLPPLYELATLRHRKKKDGGQVLTYDVDLLNTGNGISTTIENILVKNHTLRRILENRHKEMSNRVTLEEILKTTGIIKTKRWQLQDLRNYIDNMLKSWQQQNIFKGYKWLKKYAQIYGFEILYKD